MAIYFAYSGTDYGELFERLFLLKENLTHVLDDTLENLLKTEQELKSASQKEAFRMEVRKQSGYCTLMSMRLDIISTIFKEVKNAYKRSKSEGDDLAIRAFSRIEEETKLIYVVPI